MLIKLQFETFESANIVNFLQLLPKLVNNVDAEASDLFRPDELKQFDDGRVQQVVPSIIRLQSLHNRGKQIAADDVTIVKVILQANDFAEESQRAWTRKTSD